jgi:ATP-dependent DNA helicase RecQ
MQNTGRPIAAGELVNFDQSVSSRIRCVAREKLGFEELRPGQREAIESILDSRDTLVVQPTRASRRFIRLRDC